MDGWLTLCDFAEVINGKLYIQGGGWSRRAVAAGPFSAALAGKLLVPWNDTNKRLGLRVSLVDSDGLPVMAADEQEVKVVGEFELGRPPGLAAGSELDFPLAFKFEGLTLEAGRYRWEFFVEENLVKAVNFDMV